MFLDKVFLATPAKVLELARINGSTTEQSWGGKFNLTSEKVFLVQVWLQTKNIPDIHLILGQTF